jgi:capsule polysaccharide export protein KpsE/RkpR
MAFNDRAAIFNSEHIEYYGGKDDLNRVMTIAQSAPVANYIIQKYNLPKHYKLDTIQKHWKTKVRKTFDDNYKVIKTEQNAIEISILDTDPVKAAAIITDITQLIDSIYRGIELEAKRKQLEIFKERIITQQARVDHYQDTLAFLESKFNIKIKASSDRTDIIEGSDNRAVQLYRTLYILQKNAVNEYNYRVNIKEQIENTLMNDNKCLAIIEAPSVADKKEKPMRSVIVLTVMLISLVVSVLGVLLFEQVEDIRKQL